jgi:hypothetical protein
MPPAPLALHQVVMYEGIPYPAKQQLCDAAQSESWQQLVAAKIFVIVLNFHIMCVC